MTLEARYSSNNGMGYEEKLNASAKVQIYLGYETFKRRIKACKKFPCVWLLAKCICSIDSSVRSHHVSSDEPEIIEGSIALPRSNFPSDNLPLLITSKQHNNGQGYFICEFVLAYSVAAWSTNANEFNMISWANSEPSLQHAIVDCQLLWNFGAGLHQHPCSDIVDPEFQNVQYILCHLKFECLDRQIVETLLTCSSF